MADILEIEFILKRRYQSTLAEAIRCARGTVTDFPHLQTLDAGFVGHCLSLTEGVEPDLHAPLAEEDE